MKRKDFTIEHLANMTVKDWLLKLGPEQLLAVPVAVFLNSAQAIDGVIDVVAALCRIAASIMYLMLFTITLPLTAFYDIRGCKKHIAKRKEAKDAWTSN